MCMARRNFTEEFYGRFGQAGDVTLLHKRPGDKHVWERQLQLRREQEEMNRQLREEQEAKVRRLQAVLKQQIVDQ